MSSMEEAIRERAYHMWNEAGCPDGRADTFWLNAQRELLAQSLGQIASVKPATAKKATRAKTSAPRKRKVA